MGNSSARLPSARAHSDSSTASDSAGGDPARRPGGPWLREALGLERGRFRTGRESLPDLRSKLWVPRGSVLRTRAAGQGRRARVRSTEPRGTQHLRETGKLFPACSLRFLMHRLGGLTLHSQRMPGGPGGRSASRPLQPAWGRFSALPSRPSLLSSHFLIQSDREQEDVG